MTATLKIKCGICAELGEFGEMVIAERSGIVHHNCASDNPVLSSLTIAHTRRAHYLLGPDVPTVCGSVHGVGTLDLGAVNCKKCLEIFVSSELNNIGREPVQWP